MPAPGVGRKKKTRKQRAAAADQQRLVQRLLEESVRAEFARRAEKTSEVRQ
jgi:hypothetical protein